jgi:hypothetical protein
LFNELLSLGGSGHDVIDGLLINWTGL